MAGQRRQGPRRKTEWFGTLDVNGANLFPLRIAVATGATALLAQGLAISGGSGLSDQEGTITRMIGEVFVAIDGTAAATAGVAFGIGAIVTRREVAIAGVASLPSPELDPDASWIFYTSGQMIRETVLTNSADVGQVYRIPFDVRGQRIIRSGETVVWLGAARGATVNMSVYARYLVKLT